MAARCCCCQWSLSPMACCGTAQHSTHSTAQHSTLGPPTREKMPATALLNPSRAVAFICWLRAKKALDTMASICTVLRGRGEGLART